MPPKPGPDLHWMAFLYASGEMSAAEEADFESRLAEDQSAREAVAGVVGLSEVLAALPPEAWPRPRRLRARRALAWSGLAVAACLVAASLWSLRPSAVEPPDAAEVAMAWSDLDRGEPIGSEFDYLEPVAELDAPADHAIPSWIMAAAGSSPDDVPQEEN